MKQLLIILFCFNGFFSFCQQKKEALKPQYVIISNDKIITKTQLEEYAKKGLIKLMQKSVTEEEFVRYKKKFGNKIEDREFIIRVDLLTENEKLELQKKQKSQPIKAYIPKDKTKELFLNVNDVATDFTVQMVDNSQITLSDLKGKVVLINYWATWCAPCLMEFAEFTPKLLDKFKKEDFVLIPIAIGENKEKVLKKMKKMEKYGVFFNVGVDPDKTIWNQYATGAIPKSFIIDKSGVVKYTSLGNTEGNVDKLAKQIELLISTK